MKDKFWQQHMLGATSWMFFLVSAMPRKGHKKKQYTKVSKCSIPRCGGYQRLPCAHMAGDV